MSKRDLLLEIGLEEAACPFCDSINETVVR